MDNEDILTVKGDVVKLKNTTSPFTVFSQFIPFASLSVCHSPRSQSVYPPDKLVS